MTSPPLPAEATISDLGEFGLVDAIAQRFPQGDDVLLGPGDDAALVSFGPRVQSIALPPRRSTSATVSAIVPGSGCWPASTVRAVT